LVAACALLVCACLSAPAEAALCAPGFRCGALTVPIDRDGLVPGSLVLHYVVQAQGPAPVLLDLAGGPGEGSDAARSFNRLRGLLGHYRLAVLDQRGTGASGALNCPALQRARDLDPGLVGTCAGELGAPRSFYSTTDSVLDIEDLRQALGTDQLALAGTSYGTYVALQYARAFPARVERLILNSSLPSDGLDTFWLERYRAVGGGGGGGGGAGLFLTN
jgi:pimeloyl-ACP methyl ester carboxylesterase